MTDIAIAGLAALQQPSVHTVSTSTIPDPSHLTPHSQPVHSGPFNEYSSQESTDSQPSRPTTLKLSTANVINNTFPANAIEDLTPPSSTISDCRSRQHATLSTSPPQDNDASLVKTRQSSDPSLESHHGSQSPPIVGIKRTANGEIKKPVLEGHEQVDNAQSGQTTGTFLNGSSPKVEQISQQLRTKLKYAMVKVQNGWQARSLDEVESLASASPRSAISGFNRGFDRESLASPRQVMSAKHRKWSESESSDSTTSDPRSAIVSPSQTMRTLDIPNQRSLAPPATILSNTRRRPTPNMNGAYTGPTSRQGQVRYAQTGRPGPSQRTASQDAAMEADAVETLLFMASPNNSGYRPPTQISQESSLRSTQLYTSLTSPLRAQFSQTSVTSPKRVNFTDRSTVETKSEVIDRILDNISDESDPDLEEAMKLAEKSMTNKITT